MCALLADAESGNVISCLFLRSSGFALWDVLFKHNAQDFFDVAGFASPSDAREAVCCGSKTFCRDNDVDFIVDTLRRMNLSQEGLEVVAAFFEEESVPFARTERLLEQ